MIGFLAKRRMAKLIGMAKKEMKLMMDIQLPIPLELRAICLLPYYPMVFNLIMISSKLVRKLKRGANGKDTAKNAMKPIWITASL